MRLGQAAATLQALQTSKSGQRMFSRLHLMASKALPKPYTSSIPPAWIGFLNSAFHDAGAALRPAGP